MEPLSPHEPETANASTVESVHLLHDSMVTVRLSEPPSPDFEKQSSSLTDLEEESTPELLAKTSEQLTRISRTVDRTRSSRHSSLSVGDDTIGASSVSAIRRASHSSTSSAEGDVNWEELEKTEDQEPRDQDSEESTALLLARLEQENNLLAINPKSGLTPISQTTRSRSESRPPSMQHLKNLVNGPTPPALRYSLIPAPPMTDLEFYAALVQDYKRTAQRLPTLLSKKIRNGVPPPLRGVVWQSMSGARDHVLEDEFDRLCGESSVYEGMIGKDIGRSFPGVEMFRDPQGDGQLMLGRVLKCFSLYDHKIGYCQGLGFLVGPLLMHMGDKQAFCVLVRLMEHYDLRSCFLPDLSGLHVRIYQFGELLKRHLPALSAHLDSLQIEPTYVSQWFLSFFAVTCPLPMLFRIFDVIFAEGASETLMRVALSVMRKNEEKIVACTEFEDVMQLLLSRGLWDCYHYNADEFVNDFVSLTSIVTNESLQALKASYKEFHYSEATTSPTSDIGSAASRFLGRLWAGAGSATSTKSTTLSPSLVAPTRPVSFLRRSTSKQSLTSTLNSIEGSSDSMVSSVSTEATTLSRDSANTDGSSIRGQSTTVFANVMVNAPKMSRNKDKDLHGQIEDLLTALSEMQRDHAILATQLQKEREEREEDRQAVRSLLDGLRKKASSDILKPSESEDGSNALIAFTGEITSGLESDLQASEPVLGLSQSDSSDVNQEVEHLPQEVTQMDLSRLLDNVEERFSMQDNRRTSMLQSKSQMREELARSKEQLITEMSKSQDLSRRLYDAEQELLKLKEQLKESHIHIRNAHQEKQRLEKQLQDIRSKRSGASSPDKEIPSGDGDWQRRASGHAGLRELKLGRTNSNHSQRPAFSKRSSSLATQSTGKENETPSSPTESSPTADNDALVIKLIQAKTAEAVAKQEAEEAKAKLESLRKLLGMSGKDSLGHRVSPSQPNIAITSNLTSYTRLVASPPPATPTSASAGFWGGWGKRSVSTEKVNVAQDKA